MSGAVREEVVRARAGLLDALDALQDHLDALIIVGAQAVYLHTGEIQVALAEYTTDGDVALDPQLLSSNPLIEEAMRAARFAPEMRESAIGTWISPHGVPVDLMVPEALAGKGRRSVRVPPHSPRSMRRSRGLEAALVDKSRMVIDSMEPERDPRRVPVAVAGPGALLVAKLHKINDRISYPSRLDNKDAHDIYRILRAVDTDRLIRTICDLMTHELSAEITGEALVYLRELFAEGAHAQGSRMAGAAEDIVGDPVTVAESVALLAQDLVMGLDASAL